MELTFESKEHLNQFFSFCLTEYKRKLETKDMCFFEEVCYSQPEDSSDFLVGKGKYTNNKLLNVTISGGLLTDLDSVSLDLLKKALSIWSSGPFANKEDVTSVKSFLSSTQFSYLFLKKRTCRVGEGPTRKLESSEIDQLLGQNDVVVTYIYGDTLQKVILLYNKTKRSDQIQYLIDRSITHDILVENVAYAIDQQEITRVIK